MKGVFLAALLIFPCAVAKTWECDYGIVKGWVNVDGRWRDAMVETSLRVNERFMVKIEIVTKVNCSIDFFLFEPGKTKAYEVTKGISKNGEHIIIYNCSKGWNKNYTWVVKTTGKWVDGTAPLNIGVWFIKGVDDYNAIGKTLVMAYIKGETKKRNTAGFEAFISIPIIIMLAIKMNKKGIASLPMKLIISLILISFIISLFLIGLKNFYYLHAEKEAERQIHMLDIIFNEMIYGDARNLDINENYVTKPGEKRIMEIDLPSKVSYIAFGMNPNVNALTLNGNIIYYKIEGRSEKSYLLDEEIRLRAGEYVNNNWIIKKPEQGFIIKGGGKIKLTFELVKQHNKKYILIYPA